MRKSVKALFVAAALAVAAPLSVSAFEWSECWCNYGGGIEQGDLILTIGGGINTSYLAWASYRDYWFVPPVMVEVQYAQKIWKLPFTFGGYAGIGGYGYSYLYETKFNASTLRWEDVYKDYYVWNLFFGGEAAYHVMLPPKGLDVYVVTRMGANIPFHPDYGTGYYSYFNFGEALGASWYFGDVFGLNLEFGYPLVAKFGVNFKF